MNNLLLWIGGLLVVVLAALFAVPHFVDWTRYRGVFEEEASRVLGRDVRVAGAVNLRLLPMPFVRFEKVRLADAAGQTGEPFFRVEDFTLWLSPAPLLKGAIEANRIELRRPIIKLRLNGNGGGNWQTLSMTRGALPFVPSDVALQSVQISDGVISVDRADGQELGRIEAVSGELLVAALEGPFRFRGGFSIEGAQYDLKASTTTFEADGALRAKAVLTAAATSNTYTVDGRIADLGSKPRFDGQLSGQIAMASVPIDVTQLKPATSSPANKGGAALPIDVRGSVAVDTSGASFTDVSFAFENNGKPQLVAGIAQASWARGLDIKSEFSSRWLDLDLAFANQNAAKPFDVLRTMMGSVAHLVPSNGQGQSTITVDQINLGGEALSDARLVVQRDQSALRITDLRAALPGGGRLQVAGSFVDPGKPANFDGDLSLRGASLSKLLGWVGVSTVMPDGRSDGAYALRGKFALTDQSVSLSEASASIAAARLSGGITYGWEGRRRLDLILDGDRIDIGAIAPGALNLQARVRELANVYPPAGPVVKGVAVAAKPVGDQERKPLFDAGASDLTLQIRAGHLVDGDVDLRDVDVDLRLINRRLTVSRAHFTSARGLELEAEGDIADIGVRGRGQLRGSMSAPDPEAMGEFADLLGLQTAAAASHGLRAAAPARVAWSLKLAEVKDAGSASFGRVTTELTVDGSALGRRLVGTVKLDDSTADWREHPLDFSLAIDQPDWPRLRTVFGSGVGNVKTTELGGAAPTSDARAQLLVKAVGRASQGLVSFVRVEGDGAEATFSGRLELGADALSHANGDVQVRVADAARAASLFGMPAADGLNAVAVNGAIEVGFKDSALTIKPRALDVAGAVVDGDLTISRLNDRSRVVGRLVTTQASIPRLIDLLVDNAASVETGDANSSIWRQAPFNLGMLDHWDGKVRLEADVLTLTEGLRLGRATTDIEFNAAKINVTTLEGDVLGARLSSQWLLERAAAGVTLSGAAKVAGLRLDRLRPMRGQRSNIAGTAALTLNVSGRGLTPRGVVSAFVGKGEIELVKAEIGGLLPDMVRGIADDVIGAKIEATAEAVERAVKEQIDGLADGPARRLPLGNRTIGFGIVDGVVKVRDFVVDTSNGRASNKTTIELGSLKIDSEWKLEVRGGSVKAPAAALPAVIIAFVGPVANLGGLDSVISADALVRELAVRRMERDVEELERLRRVDEERARVEAERLRLEQERIKAETERLRAAAEARAAAVAAGLFVEPVPAGAATPAALEPAPTGAAAIPADPAAPKQAASPGRTVGSRDLRPTPSPQALKNLKAQEVFKRQERGN